MGGGGGPWPVVAIGQVLHPVPLLHFRIVDFYICIDTKIECNNEICSVPVYFCTRLREQSMDNISSWPTWSLLLWMYCVGARVLCAIVTCFTHRNWKNEG